MAQITMDHGVSGCFGARLPRRRRGHCTFLGQDGLSVCGERRVGEAVGNPTPERRRKRAGKWGLTQILVPHKALKRSWMTLDN
jgi:hypothetical protein